MYSHELAMDQHGSFCEGRVYVRRAFPIAQKQNHCTAVPLFDGGLLRGGRLTGVTAKDVVFPSATRTDLKYIPTYSPNGAMKIPTRNRHCGGRAGTAVVVSLRFSTKSNDKSHTPLHESTLFSDGAHVERCAAVVAVRGLCKVRSDEDVANASSLARVPRAVEARVIEEGSRRPL